MSMPIPQVIVAPDVLRAWTEECDPLCCDGLPTEGSLLRLFSSNDYMGLSCHPSVCRAAADAVLRHGMGMVYAARLLNIWPCEVLGTAQAFPCHGYQQDTTAKAIPEDDRNSCNVCRTQILSSCGRLYLPA